MVPVRNHSKYYPVRNSEFPEIAADGVITNSKEENVPEIELGKSFARVKWSLCALAAVFAATLFLVMISIRQNIYSDGMKGSYHNCGNSSVEALSLGCSFDQLMWAWYPPDCPHYGNEEFIRAEPENPWRYYDNLYHGNIIYANDANWTHILDSGVQLWGERREHLTHCVFMLLGAGKSVNGEKRYVPKFLKDEHFEHCASILLDALRQDRNWYNIETQVPKPTYEDSC